MEQMIFDKEAATRRYIAASQKMESAIKEKVRKPSVIKKLNAYKQM